METREILRKIASCNFIIISQELDCCIGFYLLEQNQKAMYCIFKYKGNLTRYFVLAAKELHVIVTFETFPASVGNLIEVLPEGIVLNSTYYMYTNPVSKLYDSKSKEDNSGEEFNHYFRTNILSPIFDAERESFFNDNSLCINDDRFYELSVKSMFMNRIKSDSKIMATIKKIRKYVYKSSLSIIDLCDAAFCFCLHECRNSIFRTSIFVFPFYSYGSVLIGNKYIYKIFNYDEEEEIVNFIKALLQKTKKNYEEIPPQVSDEAVLNKKAYEIAESSMIALLENNYNLHGIKYYRGNSLIYLTKPVSINYGNRVPEKTYQVYITYNEFLRDTEAFRAFIENPHERTQWNFSSKEINYESGMFFNFHT